MMGALGEYFNIGDSKLNLLSSIPFMDENFSDEVNK